MNEEELRELAKEEISKAIMNNLDSTLIFTYIKRLEEENRQLEFDCKQAEELKHLFMKERDKLQKENEKLNIENINLKRNQIIDKSSIPNQENFYDYYNFVSKDKIRDKLAHLEATLEGYYEAELEVNNTHETKILEEWKQWLEELLKEE